MVEEWETAAENVSRSGGGVMVNASPVMVVLESVYVIGTDRETGNGMPSLHRRCRCRVNKQWSVKQIRTSHRACPKY